MQEEIQWRYCDMLVLQFLASQSEVIVVEHFYDPDTKMVYLARFMCIT